MQRVNITWIRSLDQDKDAWISEAEFEHGLVLRKLYCHSAATYLNASTGLALENALKIRLYATVSAQLFYPNSTAVCARLLDHSAISAFS